MSCWHGSLVLAGSGHLVMTTLSCLKHSLAPGLEIHMPCQVIMEPLVDLCPLQILWIMYFIRNEFLLVQSVFYLGIIRHWLMKMWLCETLKLCIQTFFRLLVIYLGVNRDLSGIIYISGLWMLGRESSERPLPFSLWLVCPSFLFLFLPQADSYRGNMTQV